jgi:hypothetical protein
LFPSGFRTKYLNEFLVYPIRATCPIHFILLDLIFQENNTNCGSPRHYAIFPSNRNEIKIMSCPTPPKSYERRNSVNIRHEHFHYDVRHINKTHNLARRNMSRQKIVRIISTWSESHLCEGESEEGPFSWCCTDVNKVGHVPPPPWNQSYKYKCIAIEVSKLCSVFVTVCGAPICIPVSWWVLVTQVTIKSAGMSSFFV